MAELRCCCALPPSRVQSRQNTWPANDCPEFNVVNRILITRTVRSTAKINREMALENFSRSLVPPKEVMDNINKVKYCYVSTAKWKQIWCRSSNSSRFNGKIYLYRKFFRSGFSYLHKNVLLD